MFKHLLDFLKIHRNQRNSRYQGLQLTEYQLNFDSRKVFFLKEFFPCVEELTFFLATAGAGFFTLVSRLKEKELPMLMEKVNALSLMIMAGQNAKHWVARAEFSYNILIYQKKNNFFYSFRAQHVILVMPVGPGRVHLIHSNDQAG